MQISPRHIERSRNERHLCVIKNRTLMTLMQQIIAEKNQCKSVSSVSQRPQLQQINQCKSALVTLSVAEMSVICVLLNADDADATDNRRKKISANLCHL